MRRNAHAVYLSFVGDTAYLGLARPGPLFEPQVHRSLVAFAPLAACFQDLAFALEMAKLLSAT